MLARCRCRRGAGADQDVVDVDVVALVLVPVLALALFCWCVSAGAGVGAGAGAGCWLLVRSQARYCEARRGEVGLASGSLCLRLAANTPCSVVHVWLCALHCFGSRCSLSIPTIHACAACAACAALDTACSSLHCASRSACRDCRQPAASGDQEHVDHYWHAVCDETGSGQSVPMPLASSLLRRRAKRGGGRRRRSRKNGATSEPSQAFMPCGPLPHPRRGCAEIYPTTMYILMYYVCMYIHTYST